MADYVTYLTVDHEIADPLTAKEALSGANCESWTQAMQNEIKFLEENHTWTSVKSPANKKIFDIKWVFKTKIDVFGKIEKRKARLVQTGADRKPESITKKCILRWHGSLRLLLAIAVKYDLEVHHMDMTTAYLQGNLQVDPWQVGKQICYTCFHFGHIGANCHGKARCNRCGGLKHFNAEECERISLPPSCINCKGEHLPIQPSCPEFIKQRSIQTLAFEENIPILEAWARVVKGSHPRLIESYMPSKDFPSFVIPSQN